MLGGGIFKIFFISLLKAPSLETILASVSVFDGQQVIYANTCD